MTQEPAAGVARVGVWPWCWCVILCWVGLVLAWPALVGVALFLSCCPVSAWPRVCAAVPCGRGRDEAGAAVDSGCCRGGGDGDDDAAGAKSESVAHRQM